MARAPLTILATALGCISALAVAQSASALNQAEITCRDSAAKATSKYVDGIAKVVARCHYKRSKGKFSLSVDCNDIAQADTGKIVRAANKLRSAVGGSKDRCAAASGVLPAYPSCLPPVADADDGGATSDVDDFSEVAECLVASGEVHMEAAVAAALGAPTEVPSAAATKCQRAIGKAFARVIKTYGKERRRCQNTVDKLGAGLYYDCDQSDPKGRIGKSLVRLNDAIASRCDLPTAELDKLNACGNTVSQLRDCVGDLTAAPTGALLIKLAYTFAQGGATTTTTVAPTTTTSTTTSTTTTLPLCALATAPTCGGACPPGEFCIDNAGTCGCQAPTGICAPATILRTFNAMYDTPATGTQLSTGWSGTAHEVDVPNQTGEAVDVTCDSNCENCSISLNTSKTLPEFPVCRCTGDPSVACDVINGPDTECTGLGATCQCNFGAPLAISSGGTPVCIINRIANDYGGTMNLLSGEWYDDISLTSLVHLGISQFAPCPTCNNDVAPNDGVRDGSCSGGLRQGFACDENGNHETFGPTSYDCPPDTTQNISGGGLQIALHFTTATQSLASSVPCDSPFGDCPCTVCSGDESIPCSSDDPCIAAGAGSCVGPASSPGASVRPNACSDLNCSAQGECAAGPVDTYCDGVTHPDGRGFATCVTDADCQALGAGLCSISESRRCFPDPIQVAGHADPLNAARGAIFCIPPTTSFAVNSSAGLPGPGTFELDFDADVRCQSDPTIAWQFPDGANCLGGVTTTSTTTTTLLPACGSAMFPACGGTCAGMQLCTPNALTMVCECL